MPYFALFLSVLMLSPTVQAASDWKSCKTIGSDAARLQCYDEYAHSLEGTDSKPDIDAQKSSFGLPKTSPADDLPAIDSRIQKVEKTSRGTRIVYLDNGQVWRQIGSSSQPGLKKGDAISIERGALGSFILKRQGVNRSLRVKRIQ